MMNKTSVYLQGYNSASIEVAAVVDNIRSSSGHISMTLIQEDQPEQEGANTLGQLNNSGGK